MQCHAVPCHAMQGMHVLGLRELSDAGSAGRGNASRGLRTAGRKGGAATTRTNGTAANIAATIVSNRPVRQVAIVLFLDLITYIFIFTACACSFVALAAPPPPVSSPLWSVHECMHACAAAARGMPALHAWRGALQVPVYI